MIERVKKKRNPKDKLVRTGMGFYAFSGMATALNVILLPIASEYNMYSKPLMLISFMLAMAAFLLMGRKLARADTKTLEHIERIAVPVFLCVLFVIHLLMGYWMEYIPKYDNYMVYNGAQMLVEAGDFSADPSAYLYLSRFSNQWGMLLFFKAIQTVFKMLGITNIFFATTVVQAILYQLAMMAMLAIAKLLRGVRGVLMTIFMLVTCFPMYLASAPLYTDTFSLPFVLFALLFALRALQAKSFKGQAVNAIACALSVMVGGQIKMTVAIILVAATIFFVIYLRPVRAIALSLAMWGILALGIMGVRQTMVGPVLDRDMVERNSMPLLHWIMMSVPTKDNAFGVLTVDYDETWAMMEEGASREEIMDSIHTRLKDKIYTLRYPNRLIPAILKKNAGVFGDGTFGMTDALDDYPQRENWVSSIVLMKRPYYPIYSAICSGIFAAHLLLSALSCMRDILRHDLRAGMLYVAMFGCMLFMLIWESRSRYIFNFVPLVLLMSCCYAVGTGRASQRKIQQTDIQ